METFRTKREEMESKRFARGKETELGCWVAEEVGRGKEVEERGLWGLKRGRVLVGVKEERKNEVAAIVEDKDGGEEGEGGGDKVFKRRRGAVDMVWQSGLSHS